MVGAMATATEAIAPPQPPHELTLAFHGRVIDHLGIQMYQSPIAAVAELVANAWDADAEHLSIKYPDSIGDGAELVIEDDGTGMTFEQVQARYLEVGRNRRGDNPDATTSDKGRPVLGRKGIGKFAGFGIAEIIDVRTISGENGELTCFRLNLTALRGESYSEKEPAPVEVIEYGPPDEERRAEHGSTITLRNLTLKQTPSQEVQAAGLARRFLLHQRVNDFEITVNGSPLPADTDEKAIEFDFPRDYRDGEGPDDLNVADDGFGEEKLPNGDPVRWRIVFYEDTIDEQELQGIAVFAGGKLAQSPFWFELVGGTTAQAGQPYMSGRVEADFLDHKDEDLIATERQRVNWQHESTQELLAWGKKRMRDLLAVWGRRRKEEKQKVLDEKLAPFAERLGRFQPSEQKVVRAALLKIGAVSQINVGQFTALAESVIVAWENGRLKELIHSVAEARDMPDESLIEILVEANVLTALAMAEAVKTKLLVVEGLKQRIEKTELENSLRDYIAEHPWLLGPEWETYKKETSPTKLLESARKEAGLDDPESWPGRLDLALVAGTTLLIVEFMRPGLTIDVDHLQRWENYVRLVKTEITANTELRFESVQGIIVADKLAKKAHVIDKVKSLNAEGMRALDWPNLLTRAGAEWREYFELLVGRGPNDERLRKLGEELGIDIPEQVKKDVAPSK
jgi:hypothetical protein